MHWSHVLLYTRTVRHHIIQQMSQLSVTSVQRQYGYHSTDELNKYVSHEYSASFCRHAVADTVLTFLVSAKVERVCLIQLRSVYLRTQGILLRLKHKFQRHLCSQLVRLFLGVDQRLLK